MQNKREMIDTHQKVKIGALDQTSPEIDLDNSQDPVKITENDLNDPDTNQVMKPLAANTSKNSEI